MENINGVNVANCIHAIELNSNIRCTLMKGTACKDKWLCINNPFCEYKKKKRRNYNE